jgi:hypothetical protein
VTLTWTGGGSGNAKVFFHVLRAHRLEPVLQGVPPFPNAKEGLLCNATQKGGYFQHSGPARCSLHMSDIAGTADRTFVDKPGPGNWVYRIAVGSNWRNDASQSDLFTFSAPVRVKLRR